MTKKRNWATFGGLDRTCIIIFLQYYLVEIDEETLSPKQMVDTIGIQMNFLLQEKDLTTTYNFTPTDPNAI